MSLAALLAIASGCAPAADAPWAPPVATQPRRTQPVAPRQAAPEGPLRLVAVAPAPGSDVEPDMHVTLRFDRAIDAASVQDAVSFRYVEPRAVFVEDPFLVTAAWLSPEGDVVNVQPPDLLPGREVRFFVREGALRARDGSVLPRAPDAPPGLAFEAPYRVKELPDR